MLPSVLTVALPFPVGTLVKLLVAPSVPAASTEPREARGSHPALVTLPLVFFITEFISFAKMIELAVLGTLYDKDMSPIGPEIAPLALVFPSKMTSLVMLADFPSLDVATTVPSNLYQVQGRRYRARIAQPS